jgi:hypothetical protein
LPRELVDSTIVMPEAAVFEKCEAKPAIEGDGRGVCGDGVDQDGVYC